MSDSSSGWPFMRPANGARSRRVILSANFSNTIQLGTAPYTSLGALDAYIVELAP